MAADLGFVVDAAEAHARELAPGRLGDALAERGLAHAGRTDEAQDRALAGGIQLAHREKLENAPLDLLEAVVILVEDAPRLGDVDRRFRFGRPGQLDQPLEIRADHRVLAGGFGHALETLQLLARVLLDLRRHLGFGDRLGELGDLGGTLVAFAQLLLDGAHLLAQQVLAVGFADRRAGPLVDLARDLQDLDAVRQQLEQLVEPRLEVEGLQQRLLLLGADVHQPGDEVRELRRVLDRLERGHHLLGDLRQQLQDLVRALPEAAGAPVDLGVRLLRLLDELHARDGERIAFQELQHAEARRPCRWRDANRPAR